MKANNLLARMKKYKLYYMIIIPGFLYYLIFHYVPMYGIIIAFKDILPFEGIDKILSAPFVGFKHFINFFNSYYFWNILRNTLVISLYRIIFGFPAPIIFALLLNEVRNLKFKRITQTISYLPHFISMVVLAGLVTSLLSVDGGIVNEAIKRLGGTPILFLGDPRYFRGVLVWSNIWKEVGWGSIIYLAAITGINPELYEASKIDGCNRWKQVFYITLPGIGGIIAIMLIFAVGNMLSAGFEQIMLLYSPVVYEVSDIIDTYVYREGLISLKYSFATAVGLFKSVAAAILLLTANYIAKKLDHPGIW